ncbi:hypothetical protein OOK29_10100 [Streptomyces phaeochromogenes]|uniref:hypothetical protein n=1 Tax=Streptomyces phaeochromogenes TaxID=1923 RepID=UPI0022528E4A|nr:hypothetical protein [Streptomyces phaeochromogenes]MCX5598491.1 hypothetical protein [Streptomyces phaeochromogenes]
MSMAHPHHLTVTEIDGERSVDWTHPADCPDGEHCDIRRRARRMRSEAFWELVEAICEDAERVVELARIIQHGQAVEQAEDASNRAVNTLIDDYLGTMRAYTAPIDRLLGDAA